MSTVLIAVVAFVAMEPVTAWTHRFVMHGVGWVLHRSHHEALARRWEANDAFPVMFGSVVCIGFAIGFNIDEASVLVPVGIGVTAYGVAYALVHDGLIHRRFPLPRAARMLTRLGDAHAIHHRDGGAPYGMLLPVTPRSGRSAAAGRAAAQQTGERIAPAPRS